jgi:hypothetical protein
MNAKNGLRKTMLLAATAVAAFGATLGLPVKKALAAAPNARALPANQMPILPTHVSPSAATLVKIADQAMSDRALAERIFKDPDAVASQYNLSKAERAVLSKMTREQFQTARADAAAVVAGRLARPDAKSLPQDATNARLIAERMVVGRAILAAVGRSYLDAAYAHDCCPWNKSIELGVMTDPAAYDVVFSK